MIWLREKSVTTNAQVGGASLQCLDCYVLTYLPVIVCRACLSVFHGEMSGYSLLADHQAAMFYHCYMLYPTYLNIHRCVPDNITMIPSFREHFQAEYLNSVTWTISYPLSSSIHSSSSFSFPASPHLPLPLRPSPPISLYSYLPLLLPPSPYLLLLLPPSPYLPTAD